VFGIRQAHQCGQRKLRATRPQTTLVRSSECLLPAWVFYVPRAPDGALGKQRPKLKRQCGGQRSGSARWQGSAPARRPDPGPLCHRVEVVDFPDSRLEVRYKGRSMLYRTFDKLRRVSETAMLENKRLGGLLTLIRQASRPSRRTCAPARARSGAIRPSTCSASADPAPFRAKPKGRLSIRICCSPIRR